MNVEPNQKLLVNASSILLLQNTLIFASIVINIVLQQSLLLSLIQLVTWGFDIVGFALLGAGLYRFSKAIPIGGLFAEKSGLLLLLWVPITLIWRLAGRLLSSSPQDVTQLGQAISTTTSMLWVFFLASFVLTFAVLNLNKMIGQFQEHGLIMEGGGGLYSAYAVLNVIGAFIITLGLIGSAPFLEQLAQIDPNNPPTSLGFARGGIFLLLLSSVGQFIKGLVVPILGLLLFSQLRGLFLKIELQSEDNSQ